jgi:hypothetical protein
MTEHDIPLDSLLRDHQSACDLAFEKDAGAIILSAPDASFGDGGLGEPLLILPAAQPASDPVLAQLEAWLDAILVERAARDSRE